VQFLLQAGADTQLYNDNNKLAGEEFDLLFEVRTCTSAFYLFIKAECIVVHVRIDLDIVATYVCSHRCYDTYMRFCVSSKVSV
jgi:hypothetical protein